jgi:hypothetical protein
MVGDHFLDMAGGYGEMWAHSLRCVNCGTVYDAVIEQNRLLRQEAVSAPVGGGQDSQEEDIYLGAEAIIRPAVPPQLQSQT